MNRGELIADRFEIDRFAARGGMGEVYRAFDRHTGELAAIKVVTSDGSAEVLQRFAREARVLSELHHPAIVRYLGHGRAASGQLYLAMEWLEGEDLATRLHAGSELSIDEVVRLATRAAAALAAAHARGVVHRDIKPSNLFLAGDRVDDVKLLDFGVARLVGGLALTASGLLIGTPAFMAPEQLAGERDIGPPADVFALGAVIYRCLCGRNPFEADSVGALVAFIAGHDPPPLRSLRPEVPAALDELIARMLAKQPRERFEDAGALLAGLIALGAPFDDTRRAGALTASERHPLCLIVAGDAPAERIAAAAAVHDVLANSEAGCIVVGGQPLAADLARQAARCALSLRAVAPDASIAVVTGYGVRAAARAGRRPGRARRRDPRRRWRRRVRCAAAPWRHVPRAARCPWRHHTAMARVLVEQTFDPPIAENAHAALLRKLDICLEMRDGIRVRSYVAPARDRFLYELEAPDAEKARNAMRSAGFPFVQAFTVDLVEPDPSPRPRPARCTPSSRRETTRAIRE